MELLPIIYWSLVGFGILTLFVVILSFLTYHIRKKLEKIPSKNVDHQNSSKNIYSNPGSMKQHHPKVVKQTSEKIFPKYQYRSNKNKSKRITILNDHLDDKI